MLVVEQASSCLSHGLPFSLIPSSPSFASEIWPHTDQVLVTISTSIKSMGQAGTTAPGKQCPNRMMFQTSVGSSERAQIPGHSLLKLWFSRWGCDPGIYKRARAVLCALLCPIHILHPSSVLSLLWEHQWGPGSSPELESKKNQEYVGTQETAEGNRIFLIRCRCLTLLTKCPQEKSSHCAHWDISGHHLIFAPRMQGKSCKQHLWVWQLCQGSKSFQCRATLWF